MINKHRLHSSFGHSLLKKWQSSPSIQKEDLVYPLFISDVSDELTEMKLLPGQYRIGIDKLNKFLEPIVKKGLKSVLVFGVLSEKDGNGKDENKDDLLIKDGEGSCAFSSKSPAKLAIELIAKQYPDILIIADVCLCGYTDHGHCGIVNEKGEIKNKESIEKIAKLAGFYAKAGAHVIAPSDMMDGRIEAIKNELKELDLDGKVSVMSYSAKFASNFYGPFREAAKSGMKFGDRSFYQLPVGSRKLALRALKRDIEEGADMIMVKPGMPYLDIVRDAKEISDLPIAIYQVSGEYAMIYFAAQAGAINKKKCVLESLDCMKRAGANILITYYTPEVLDWINEDKA